MSNTKEVWNYRKIITSISTTLDINWGNNHKDVKKFFRIISYYFGIGEFLIDNIQITDKSYRNHVYWKGKKVEVRQEIFDWRSL